MTQTLFLEYEAVLKRPEQRLVHGLSVEALDAVLVDLAALVVPVSVHFRLRPQLVDADDEHVLEAAVNAAPYALVTHNVRHFEAAAAQFGLRVRTPGAILMERF